jgi:hypothetical protein
MQPSPAQTRLGVPKAFPLAERQVLWSLLDLRALKYLRRPQLAFPTALLRCLRVECWHLQPSPKV